MRANAAGGAVFDVDRGPHADLVTLAVGLEREKGRSLHQPNHVGRGINRRQPGVVDRERVFKLDSFPGFTARPDWNLSRHKLTCFAFQTLRSQRANDPRNDSPEIIGSRLRGTNTLIYAANVNRAASIPSRACHNILAVFSAASRAVCDASGFAAIRFS